MRVSVSVSGLDRSHTAQAAFRDGAHGVASTWGREESHKRWTSAHRPANFARETTIFGAKWTGVRPNLGPNPGNIWPKSGRGAPVLVQLGQSWLDFGRIWPNSVHFGRHQAKFGRVRADSGAQFDTNFGATWADFGPNSAKLRPGLGQTRQNWVEIRQASARCAPIFMVSSQTWPVVAWKSNLCV